MKVFFTVRLFCRCLAISVLSWAQFLRWGEAQDKSMSLCLKCVPEYFIGSMDPVQQAYMYVAVFCIEYGEDFIVLSSELEKVFEFKMGRNLWQTIALLK